MEDRRRLSHNREPIAQLDGGEAHVHTQEKAKAFKCRVEMEVLASVILFQLVVTVWLIVQYIIS